MSKLKIEGVPPHDGDYDLDITAFTGAELHTIKQISGVRAGELQEGLTAGDYDLVVAFTVIVLQRAGQNVDPAAIMAAEVGSITIDLNESDAEVVDDRPPVSSPTPNGNENSPGVGPNSNESTEPSGSPSIDAGGQPVSLPEAIGSPF